MSTILLTGAGSSKDLEPEFGLGADLVRDISDRVTDRTSKGHRYLSNILTGLQTKDGKQKVDWHHQEHFVIELDKFIKETNNKGSIDQFMDEVNSFPEYIGLHSIYNIVNRFAIAFHILGYEGALKGNINKLKSSSNYWPNSITEYLEQSSDLEIITFNYDRVFEYLLNGKIDKEVLHIYGTLDSVDELCFGYPNDKIDTIKSKMNNLQLMYDRTEKEQNNKYEIVASKINKSNKLLIFGFGFDELNCTRIGLQDFKSKNAYVNLYGGDSSINKREMAKKVRRFLPNANITYLPNKEFLDINLQEKKE